MRATRTWTRWLSNTVHAADLRRARARLTGVRADMYDAIATSSTAREQLREAIHDPSVETALSKVQEFLQLGPLSDQQLRHFVALRERSLLEPIEYTAQLFKDWFFNTRANLVVNMHEPWTWYPKARLTRRRIIFHAGPTNSGKTHAALQRLLQARSGVYCAPIKALASQMWARINSVVPCDLLIGDERKYGGYAEHVSCTMEMTPIDDPVDVAVLDEIQLLEDPNRGWAFTRALLGIPAREVHLCGEWRSVRLVESILRACKEERSFSVVNHQRLVPLDIDRSLNGDYSKLVPGDCMVVFSRRNIYTVKADIERNRPDLIVNIVYGGLPFKVREEQTAQFNNGVVNGRPHVLVATDAIAYGLNLNIRRMIFTTMRKFNGYTNTILEPSNILQVAGRAGRFGLKFADRGFATTFYEKDMRILKSCMGMPRLPDIKEAGLIPTAEVLLVYSEIHPEIKSFYELMDKFSKEATTSKMFFVCDMEKSLLAIAKLVEDVDLTLRDRILFCFVPMSARDARASSLLRAYAVAHSKGEVVEIGIAAPSRDALKPEIMADLETDCRMLEIYSWLALRLTNTFQHYEKARLLKEEIEDCINYCLMNLERGVVPFPQNIKTPKTSPEADNAGQ